MLTWSSVRFPCALVVVFVVTVGTHSGVRLRHCCCGHGFDYRFLLSLCLFQPHHWRLGVVFPFELVALEVMLLSLCLCFDRTLGGWAWFFLSSWLPLRSCCCLGFRPPREAGAALMLPRAPAGVGQRLRSDVGPYVNRHRRFGSAEEGRSCAEASTLFSRHGGGERTLVINAKERH